MRRIVPLLLVLTATAQAQELPGTAPIKQPLTETAHYRLYSDGPPAEAKEFGRVLEAAYTAFEKWFKKKPKLKKGAKLVVRFFEKQAAWKQAILDDQGQPPKAGGFYWPVSRVVYLYRQPSAYYTRTLLLHEAGHQFHYLACTRNRAPTAFWYTEGIVEYLAAHHWDGTKLTLGVLPTVSLEDYAARALREISAPEFDLRKFVETPGSQSRAVGWALMRFLAHGFDGKAHKKFTSFRRKMDGGNTCGPLFKRTFKDARKLQAQLLAWLKTQQEPLQTIFVDWQGRGPRSLRGISRSVALCRVKGPVEYLKVKLHVPRGKVMWLAGVMLHYTSPEDYSVALLDRGHGLRVLRRNGKRWQPQEGGMGQGPGPDKDGNYVLQVFRKKGKVYLVVNEASYGPWEFPGMATGLAIDKCDVTFSDLEWRAAPPK